MKKKYITGLLMMAVSAMLFTGCGFSIGKEIPVKDLIAGASQDSDKNGDDNEDVKDTGTSFTYEVNSGDQISVGISGGYTIRPDGNKFDITKDGSVIGTGFFIDSDGYDSYYSAISQSVTDIDRIDIAGDISNGAYSYDGKAGTEYDLLAWINGTNTGFMVGSIDVDKELVKDALSCLQIQAVSKGKDGIDKDALSDADTTYAAQEEVADTDAAASDTIEDTAESMNTAQDAADDAADTAEDAQDQSDFLPDGFTVSYSCDYFTDYDDGDVSVRINEGEIDSDIQNFLDENGTSYYGTYQLSRIGVCDLAAGSVAIIEGEGNSVYKYFLAGGGVKMEIMKLDGSRLSADECVKYLNLFAD